MVNEFLARTTWGAPLVWSADLIAVADILFLDAALPIPEMGDEFIPSDNDELSFAGFSNLAHRDQRNIIGRCNEASLVTIGEIAHTLCRHPNAFSVPDRMSGNLMQSIFHNNRDAFKPYESISWTFLNQDIGFYWNGGWMTGVKKLNSMGLSFDEVAPYILAGDKNFDAIKLAIEFSFDTATAEAVLSGM